MWTTYVAFTVVVALLSSAQIATSIDQWVHGLQLAGQTSIDPGSAIVTLPDLSIFPECCPDREHSCSLLRPLVALVLTRTVTYLGAAANGQEWRSRERDIASSMYDYIQILPLRSKGSRPHPRPWRSQSRPTLRNLAAPRNHCLSLSARLSLLGERSPLRLTAWSERVHIGLSH